MLSLLPALPCSLERRVGSPSLHSKQFRTARPARPHLHGALGAWSEESEACHSASLELVAGLTLANIWSHTHPPPPPWRCLCSSRVMWTLRLNPIAFISNLNHFHWGSPFCSLTCGICRLGVSARLWHWIRLLESSLQRSPESLSINQSPSNSPLSSQPPGHLLHQPPPREVRGDLRLAGCKGSPDQNPLSARHWDQR